VEAELKKGEAISGLVGDLLEGIAGRMEDVAQEAGVSYSALYSWATGRRRPGRRNLERLASLAEERAARLEELAGELRQQTRGNGRGESQE
jgi:transcriptional regulator with XRE-family HTH domain